MRGRLTLGHGNDLALELIAGAELHLTLLQDGRLIGIRSSGRGIYPIGHRVSSRNQPNDVALAFEDDPETLQPEVRRPDRLRDQAATA
jgi:hypothetical protein